VARTGHALALYSLVGKGFTFKKKKEKTESSPNGAKKEARPLLLIRKLGGKGMQRMRLASRRRGERLVHSILDINVGTRTGDRVGEEWVGVSIYSKRGGGERCVSVKRGSMRRKKDRNCSGGEKEVRSLAGGGEEIVSVPEEKGEGLVIALGRRGGGRENIPVGE